MTNRVTVKLTANFERNLADIEQFLTEAEAPQAFDGLIDELLGTVLPNLERFPELGRPFFNRAIGSAEASNAVAALKTKLAGVVGASLTSLADRPEALHCSDPGNSQSKASQRELGSHTASAECCGLD